MLLFHVQVCSITGSAVHQFGSLLCSETLCSSRPNSTLLRCLEEPSGPQVLSFEKGTESMNPSFDASLWFGLTWCRRSNKVLLLQSIFRTAVCQFHCYLLQCAVNRPFSIYNRDFGKKLILFIFSFVFLRTKIVHIKENQSN